MAIFGFLPKLSVLNMNKNKLESLELLHCKVDAVQGMPTQTGGNITEELNKGISKLEGLKCLDLSFNQIRSLHGL